MKDKATLKAFAGAVEMLRTISRGGTYPGGLYLDKLAEYEQALEEALEPCSGNCSGTCSKTETEPRRVRGLTGGRTTLQGG